MKKILTLAALVAAAALSSCIPTHRLTTINVIDRDGFIIGVEKKGVYTPIAPVPDQQSSPNSMYVGVPTPSTYYFK